MSIIECSKTSLSSIIGTCLILIASFNLTEIEDEAKINILIYGLLTVIPLAVMILVLFEVLGSGYDQPMFTFTRYLCVSNIIMVSTILLYNIFFVLSSCSTFRHCHNDNEAGKRHDDVNRFYILYLSGLGQLTSTSFSWLEIHLKNSDKINVSGKK
jgi:uncharacterized membrane protein